jgi:hypothetical protein
MVLPAPNVVSSVSILEVDSEGMTTCVYYEPLPQDSTTVTHLESLF